MATAKNGRRKPATRRKKGDPAGILLTTGENGNGTEPKRLIGPFDVGQRREAKLAECTIYDPRYPASRIDTGIRIGVRSAVTDEAKEAAKRASEGKEIRVEGGRVYGDPEAIDANIFEQTVAVTAYWYAADLNKPQRPDGTWEREAGYENAINFDGAALECTPENVRMLYENPDTRWIQEQVEIFYLNRGNFFVGPKSPSGSPRASASA